MSRHKMSGVAWRKLPYFGQRIPDILATVQIVYLAFSAEGWLMRVLPRMRVASHSARVVNCICPRAWSIHYE